MSIGLVRSTRTVGGPRTKGVHGTLIGYSLLLTCRKSVVRKVPSYEPEERTGVVFF